MWKALSIDDDHQFMELAAGDTVDAVKSHEFTDQKVFYLWDGDLPSQDAELFSLIDEVSSANGGEVVRLTFGEVQLKSEAQMLCSGNCFCVVQGGNRRCETQYCNANGYCWWVPCGTNC
jgi:hypothetical protein